MDSIEENENWDLVVKPTTSLFDIDIKELWKYRDLILLFVKRDFVSVYKQTILGPLWFFIQPILTTITFTIVFGNIAQISTDGTPKVLFYLAGVTAWSYFSECLNTTSNTFINNSNIFGKVYFPRLTVPISIVISNLIKFAIQFILFVLFILFYIIKGNENVHPNLYILFLPVLLLLMAMLALGAGIIISAFTTKYRDLRFLITFGIQLLMYATPVVYPLSLLKGNYRLIVLANPMTSIIETFKYAFTGSGTFSYLYLLYSSVFSIILLTIAILIFNKVEKTFMDTV